MTDALTPAQALAYLCELNPAVQAARMLDHGGVALAQHGLPVRLDSPGVLSVRDDERELIVAPSAEAVVELVRVDATAALAAVRCAC